jgi:hypothetical protein
MIPHCNSNDVSITAGFVAHPDNKKDGHPKDDYDSDP